MLAPESHHRVVLIAKSGAPVPVRVHVDRRARRVSVRIDAHAREAVATAPAPRHACAAIAFAAERVEWIAKRLGALPLPVTFQPGALIPFRGIVHRLQRGDTGQTVHVERSTAIPVLSAPGPPGAFADKIRAFLRTAARNDFSERVATHAETLAVRPKAISIKDMRSRWGSCSSEGRLNFSWRLICAPPFALDYVAAHEVAHLREMNHSPRFWRHVECCAPGWMEARRWLQLNGSALHAIGEP
jgi:predicted metal-dependent hydrolase